MASKATEHRKDTQKPSPIKARSVKKTQSVPKKSPSSREEPQKKRISLALQGGGSHGAFTWGVLEALLEDSRLEIEGISGTSAGGMNAAAVAQGIIEGGNGGAIEKLHQLWETIGDMGRKSPIQFSYYDKLIKNFEISKNPFFLLTQYISGLFSPYQLNPMNHHPLSKMADDIFNFAKISNSDQVKLFLCATHVATGKLKIFTGSDLSKQALLASACVPQLFQAVEIKGEFYWDGGFIGNPAIYPLIYNCETPDIMVIQIRRLHEAKVPTTVHDIQNRLGEITQNSCLTREMRSIAFITELIDEGIIPEHKMKRLHMHMIRDDDFFAGLERATGFCSDPDFLAYLHKAGKRAGKLWLNENYEFIGNKSTVDLEKDFIED
jgi:NTE family protein